LHRRRYVSHFSLSDEVVGFFNFARCVRKGGNPIAAQ
jgi:hypothetical protein